ncbi:MAG TPA: lipid-transfer protein [Acidimicrobiales bacterium]|jgi:acetyl-CoA acetyltransferase
MAVDVAIIGWAQTPSVARSPHAEPQLCMQANLAALAQSWIDRKDIGFTCSGSCDYLTGGPFAFVQNLDAAGAWPPIAESHVEMDGAWALYEAWTRLQLGDIDVAMVFGSGKSSPSDPAQLYPQQLDPYYLAPLGLDPTSLGALQARTLIDSGRATEEQFAEVAARSRRAARSNPNAHISGDDDAGELAKADYVRAPLRAHDVAPVSDGAAAIVLATAERARGLVDRPVLIRGLEHRLEVHQPGMRDLSRSPSTTAAAKAAGLDRGPVDVAELCALFSPQEIILRDALGLDDSVDVNPSGGALTANPVMATGLVRFIEAAQRIADGTAHRAIVHATNGQALQHNLVAVLEGAS